VPFDLHRACRLNPAATLRPEPLAESEVIDAR
jgi:hypothetical protein